MKDKVDLLLVNNEFNILEEVIEENINDNQYFIRISISASQTLDFPINISNTNSIIVPDITDINPTNIIPDDIHIKYTLSEWTILDSDPFDMESDSGKIAAQLREDVGLLREPFSINKYMDSL